MSAGQPVGCATPTRQSSRKRTVRPGQVLRDLARDMIDRDRRLRVLALGDDGRAECLVVHDHGGPTGRKPFIQIAALASPSKFELIEEADDVTADPRYAVLLAAITAVHGPDATPADYARAAFDTLLSPAVAAP
ncbi:DUF6354 family protein [Streptomyces mobaraensis]|uniref:Uncharacterized protein n=1 Tax=Streptomyces mobaraensis TaxID=35621 RepID=A0A5N5W437_STRMB|nr:DUF6354 family protein [Streptomyces mobaraensis]KAB7839467.1 hypothetical protein FRZ00_21225 [Streptomyces mobaraensis]